MPLHLTPRRPCRRFCVNVCASLSTSHLHWIASRARTPCCFASSVLQPRIVRTPSKDGTQPTKCMRLPESKSEQNARMHGVNLGVRSGVLRQLGFAYFLCSTVCWKNIWIYSDNSGFYVGYFIVWCPEFRECTKYTIHCKTCYFVCVCVSFVTTCFLCMYTTLEVVWQQLYWLYIIVRVYSSNAMPSFNIPSSKVQFAIALRVHILSYNKLEL